MSLPAGWKQRELMWLSAHLLGRTYTLRAGDDAVATLEIEGVLRRHARLESGGEVLTFVRRGLLGTCVEVRDAGESPLARLDMMWRGAQVQLGNIACVFRPTAIFSRAWAFFDEGQPVLTLERRFMLLTTRIEVRLGRDTLSDREVLILAGLGLMELRRHHRTH